MDDRKPLQLPSKLRHLQVTRISVGNQFLGAVETESGSVVVFRLNDQGGFPSGPSAECTVCKLSSISGCAGKIPKGTPHSDARVQLHRCIEKACAGVCGGGGGTGPVVVV